MSEKGKKTNKNKKILGKRVLGILLVMVMVLSNGVVALGETAPSEEAVYSEGSITMTGEGMEKTQEIPGETETTDGGQSQGEEAAGQESALLEENQETTPEGGAKKGEEIESSAPQQGMLQQVAPVPREDPGEKVIVTLNLNGGKINGLLNEGWASSSINTYIYTKEVETGAITLDNPYRGGYEFKGWQKTGSEEVTAPQTGSDSIQLTVDGASEFTAIWSEKLYNATFKGWKDGSSDAVVWKVRVPYGSVLWTMDDQTPWKEETVVWNELGESEKTDILAKMPDVSNVETAAVVVHIGTSDTEEVPPITVTRYTQKQYEQEGKEQYYYTFTLDGTPYFTYGGPYPADPSYGFAGWQAPVVDGGAVVAEGEEGTVFNANYVAADSYIFNVYYYFSNGAKAQNPKSIVKSANEVKDGILSTEIQIPEIKYYTADIDEAKLPTGVSVSDNNGTKCINANVEQAFQGNQSNKSVAIIVLYHPSEMDYKIVYHLQKVGSGTDPEKDYIEAGYRMGKARIGDTVSVPDRPGTLVTDVGERDIDFAGYEADGSSQYMVYHGRQLVESLVDEHSIAVIHMYYNRSYYYVYTLIDTTESDPYDPVRVQYGMSLAGGDESIVPQKTGYTFQEWKWYYPDSTGQLQLLNGTGDRPAFMPHHNVYAVAVWKKAFTSMQIVYWIEDANSGSYQNSYQKEIDTVPTGDRLVLHLSQGKYDMTLEDDPTSSFPVFTDSFREAIKSKYGEDNGSYTKYFTFDPEMTYKEEVEHGHAAGDSSKNQLLYEVKADGTTTINLFYKRNLYTLEFIISRTVGTTWWVPKETGNGTIPGLYWDWGSRVGATYFDDFGSSRVQNETGLNEVFGTARITGKYRLKEAVARGDTRAVTGRYGTRATGNTVYRVYYLTARFEAEIAELWPTMENIRQEKTADDSYKYISMGTNANSLYYYLRTLPGAAVTNKNILNQYSKMDTPIVDGRDRTTVPDNDGKGSVTHQLYAYWAYRNIKKYDYYFLYEVLDTTLNVNEYQSFDARKAAAGEYKDGDIVKWSYKGDTSLYIYRNSSIGQYSTHNIQNQNQPSKSGFINMDKVGYESGNQKKVYYFYKRELKTLSIYNVNGNWVPGTGFLNKELDLTYTDERTGEQVTGKKCLAELGWQDIVGDMTEGTGQSDGGEPSPKLIHLRYGAQLGVVSQDSVFKAFQEEAYPLKYPYKSLGVNQYYFHGWFMDQENIVETDWSTNAMQTMIQDQVLYAGWTVPKYRTTYVLNGGTWTDAVNMTIMFVEKENNMIILYYPHMASDPNTEMYWYIPEYDTDYLYMGDEFYISTLGQLMDANANGDGHYHLKPGITLEQMRAASRPKDPGTSSGGTSYVCYMQGEGFDGRKDESHRNYIHRHALVGTDLPEPSIPVRNGYDFLGWYAFNDAEEGTSYTEKQWLDEVLAEGEGLHSYKEEYVYINSTGEAYLLRADESEGGRLYYYADQKGYRYSYEFGASIVSEDRMLYAAWKGQEVNESKVLHLVKASWIAQDKVSADWTKITINGTDYYQVMATETRSGIESGGTQVNYAKELKLAGDNRIWLPEKAQINLEIGSGTPEGTSGRMDVYEYTGDGSCFRIRIPNMDQEAYTYYAYFVYSPVDEPTYSVYKIDLTTAVLEGALKSYSDTFDREKPPDENEAYVLGKDTYQTNEEIVTVNAPIVTNYTVYARWMESLHLQSDPSGNNIYFYYINPKNDISISITYHFMKEGGYPEGNKVMITGIPGQKGQKMNASNLAKSYETILSLAQQVRAYSGSTNDAQRAMYDRYLKMEIIGQADEIQGNYFVDAQKECTLDIGKEINLIKDYVLERTNPTGNEFILSNNTHIHVYMKDASVQIVKKDASGTPLKEAEFTLERMRKLALDEAVPGDAEIIVYENQQYVKDNAFVLQKKTTNDEGAITFFDLSTNTEPGYIYRLIETEAPVGHAPLMEPVYARVPYQITVDGQTETYYTVKYEIVNPGILYLPRAGGFGTYIPLFAGGGIFTLAWIGGELHYGKNRDKRWKDR